MLESITLDGFNVTASIDAYLHHCLFRVDGVFDDYGEGMSYEIVNNNLIKIYDGLLINQGRFLRITPGTYEEIQIANGEVGVNRKDLIVAHFETDGDNEIHDIRVLQGSDDGTIPEITTSNTFNGGTINEVPLYLVSIEGINIASVDKQFSKAFTFNNAVFYEDD